MLTKKTVIASLLLLAIYFAPIPVQGQVCQIGTTTYPTLDAALAAVQSGQTITLLASVTSYIVRQTLQSGREKTIKILYNSNK